MALFLHLGSPVLQLSSCGESLGVWLEADLLLCQHQQGLAACSALQCQNILKVSRKASRIPAWVQCGCRCP